jgi:hypothetical protein
VAGTGSPAAGAGGGVEAGAGIAPGAGCAVGWAGSPGGGAGIATISSRGGRVTVELSSWFGACAGWVEDGGPAGLSDTAGSGAAPIGFTLAGAEAVFPGSGFGSRGAGCWSGFAGAGAGAAATGAAGGGATAT